MNTVFVPEPEQFGPEPWKLVSRDIVDGIRTSVRALPILGRGILVRTCHQTPMQVDEPKDGEPEIAWSPPIMDEPTLLADALLVELTVKEPSAILDDKNQPTEMQIKVLAREILGLNIARERYQPKNGPQAIPKGVTLRPGMTLPLEQRSMVQGAQGAPPPEIMAKLREAAEKAAAEGKAS